MHIFRPLGRNFPMCIILNPSKTMVVLAALEHYRKHCEQEIAAGEVLQLRRIIQTIQDIHVEIGSQLLAIDAKDRGSGALRNPAPNSEMHRTTSHTRRRYSVVMDLDPDELMTLTEALTRLLMQCEHDRHDDEMKPFGSKANAELSASVRDDLIQAFRKTWRGPLPIPWFGRVRRPVPRADKALSPTVLFGRKAKRLLARFEERFKNALVD